MKLKLLLLLLLISATTCGYLILNIKNSPSPDDLLGASTSSQNTTITPAEGYSYVTVKTNVGTFNAYVYKANLSKYSVKTVAANKESCKKDCPTKPLKQYITENNAVAGMNGSYFCPPDYANCKGKKNSFDFAVFNSNRNVWLNKGALSWNKTAMAVFKGSKAEFCMDTTKCSKSGVTAAISNYPALVQDYKIVVDKGDVQPYQKLKGTKGAIGTDGTNVYLVLMPYTTVKEAAYVTRALGMKHALNIDGGGSSAMYVNGAYKIGPGRLLPNAIVLVKK